MNDTLKLNKRGNMIQKAFKCFAFITIVFHYCYSNSTGIDTVSMGIYLIDVYDISFPSNELKTDFYLWSKYKNPEFKLLEEIELINAKECNTSFCSDTMKNGFGLAFQKYQTTVKHNWKTDNFPFDKHRIQLRFENTNYDRNRVVNIPDIEQSNFDRKISIPGWVIKNFSIDTVNAIWESSFGEDIDASYSAYSRFVVNFDLERKFGGLTLFIKAFIGLFIAIMLSFLTFKIDPRQVDPRFGLSVGAIFASFANQYVVSSMLPETASLTLVDLLHEISYLYIFVSVLLSVKSLHLMSKNKEAASKKLDQVSLILLSSTYVVTVFILVAVNF